MFMNVLEPVTLLTALAGATTRIGLGGTVSTSFSEPYNVARQFASLDHISAGRAAWNVVTSANDYAARNFGHATLPPHALRYEKAGEFVDVVNALWNSWDDDAFILDRETGLFFDPARQHAVHHAGQVLQGRRGPQHRPLAARTPGDHPGRGVRHRAGTGGANGGSRVRQRLQPAGRQARLRRPQGPPGQVWPPSRFDEDPRRAARGHRQLAAGGRGQGPGAAGDDPSRRRPFPPGHRPRGRSVGPAARRTDSRKPVAEKRQPSQGVLRRHHEDHPRGEPDPAAALPALRARPQDHQGHAHPDRRRDGGMVHHGRHGRLHDAVRDLARRPARIS